MTARSYWGSFALAAGIALASGQAAAQSFGSWTVSPMAEGHFAASINDSGGILGKYCYRAADSCMWLLAVDVSCDDGAEYPILVNSEVGAAYLRLLCKPIEGKNRYIFMDYDTMDKAVLGGKQVGIAFPMQSGRFQVSRFNVNQAAEALATLGNRVRATARQKSDTKDRSL